MTAEGDLPSARRPRPASRLRIARLAGVPVYLDPVLPILLVGLVLTGAFGDDAGRTALVLAALVLFVVLHEAGHAWMAKRRGLRVKGIFLHLFPVTYLEQGAPDDAWRVALAGPLANLLLGTLLLLVRLATGGDLGLHAWLDDPLLFGAGANLAMGVLNLVPVLPADGGRVLRARLELAAGPRRARRVVGGLGVVVGLAIALLGLLGGTPWPFGLWLGVLGLYVAIVGLREAQRT